MRDLAVTFLFFFLVWYTIKRPFIGIAAWGWITLAYPAGWAWGFSTIFRMNFTIAILTFISYFLMKNKPKMKMDILFIFIFVLWCIALISCLQSNSLIINFVWSKFEEFTKVLLFFVAVVLVVHKKIHIDTLIWAIILAVSAYAAMEAFKFIASLGGHRIAGHRGHLLGDRNDLAVAINMCIPLILYLISQTKNKLLGIGLILLFVLNIIAVIGTYSRGGFVGLIVIAGYFFLKSNRKFIWSIITVILISISSTYVPSEWSERMDTVSTASTEDNSFIGRLWAWKISVKIANNNFFGNGFMATQDPLAWHQYRFDIDYFGFIETPTIPDSVRPKAAHSIYFQVLGDLGYMGLVLYVLILGTLFFRLNSIARKAKEQEVQWCSYLASMLSVSVVGYGITGANVSMAYFDLIFIFIGLSYVLKTRVLKQDNEGVFTSRNQPKFTLKDGRLA